MAPTSYSGTARPSASRTSSDPTALRGVSAAVTAVPTYEPLQHPLTPAAQRALNQLPRTHNLEDVKNRLKLANELLSECAGTINDRLAVRAHETNRFKRELSGKENAPRTSQGAESAEDGEEREEVASTAEREQQREKLEKMESELEALRTKVSSMTDRMDEHVRKVIDSQVRIGDIGEVLTETNHITSVEAFENAEKRGTQKRQRRPSDEDEDDEDMEDEMAGTRESFEPTLDGSRSQRSITAPSGTFKSKLDKRKDDWQSLSLTTRYSKHNDYIGFKGIVHDAVHGDDGTPLPPATKWFTELEGRGSPIPGTQLQPSVSGNNPEDESDDDIAIAREIISTKCPILLTELVDPVTSTKCPHTYERRAIMDLLSKSREDVNRHPLRGRHDINRVDKALECPVPGCKMMLVADNLRVNPVLARKIKRLQAAKRRAEADDEDDSDSLTTSQRRRRGEAMSLETSSIIGEGDDDSMERD